MLWQLCDSGATSFFSFGSSAVRGKGMWQQQHHRCSHAPLLFHWFVMLLLPCSFSFEVEPPKKEQSGSDIPKPPFYPLIHCSSSPLGCHAPLPPWQPPREHRRYTESLPQPFPSLCRTRWEYSAELGRATTQKYYNRQWHGDIITSLPIIYVSAHIMWWHQKSPPWATEAVNGRGSAHKSFMGN